MSTYNFETAKAAILALTSTGQQYKDDLLNIVKNTDVSGAGNSQNSVAYSGQIDGESAH
ncbi:MAG: hypothetical protein WBQ60_02725 [Asticcacaulis sp.]